MSHKFKTYLVGGAVRDALLKHLVVEKDWVVVGATPEDLLELGFTQVGKDFPVFLHPKSKEEYALARTERKQGNGYTGFVCDASKDVTLEQDLLRRDLTVNAMAQDEDGNIIDPYNGLDDIDNRCLRHVSNAFVEDPLRVLRVARFAARYKYLDFSVAPETMTLMATMSNSGELSTLTPERVWRETQKALSEATPFVYFDVLANAEALSVCFPALQLPSDSKGLEHAMTHTAQVLKYAYPWEKSANQCAVVCLSMNLMGSLTPTNWLVDIKAPNAVVQLAECVIKLGNYMQQHVDGQTFVQLLDAVDVWRKEAQFIKALEVIRMAHALFDNEDVQTLTQKFEKLYRVAKKVTAKDVLDQNISGVQIRHAMQQKRIEQVDALLAN
jgi:tRNA nucleotidyltransferase (CCA-adding enzyme)